MQVHQKQARVDAASRNVLGQGIYALAEAARLLGAPPATIRRWFGRSDRRSPIFTSAFARRNWQAISFLDLIEAGVAYQIRKQHDISLQWLRRAHRLAQDRLGTTHPFAHHQFFTNGRELFVRILEAPGAPKLIELRRGQHAFDSILLPFLTQLGYSASSSLADRWSPAAGILLDPQRVRGAPHVQGCLVPTSILSVAFQANHCDADKVADWYDVTAEDVRRAVAFERNLDQAA